MKNLLQNTFLCTLFIVICTSLFSIDESSKFSILLFGKSQLDEKLSSSKEFFETRLITGLSNSEYDVLSQKDIGPIELELYRSGKWNELRLARELSKLPDLNVQVILFSSLNSLIKTNVELPKFDRTVSTYKLEASYRFLAVKDGTTFAGENFEIQKKVPLTSGINISSLDQSILNDLISECVEKIIDSVDLSKSLNERILAKQNDDKMQANGQVLSGDGLVEVQIDAKIKNLMIPEMSIGQNGQVMLTDKKVEVSPTDAEIEIDGIFVGMCSNEKKIKITPGRRTIKVKKAGFIPVERTINAYDGFSITVTLEPTETERNKLRQQIRFLQEIKSGEVLNQTQLKQAEGVYEFLKNSQYSVPKVKLN